MIRLTPTPRSVIVQCKRVQARAKFRMLCPRVLPRPVIGWPPGQPPAPLVAALLQRSRRTVDGIDIGYGAGWDDPNSPHAWRNRPCCFLHFVIQRGRPAPGARVAILGGKRGRLLPASGSSYYGPYFGNHVRFFFRERGVPYVVTLHDFGRKETTALLGRLIAQLRPAATLRTPTLRSQPTIVRYDDVGARAVAATPRRLWILVREKPVDPSRPTPHARGLLLRLDPTSGRTERRIGVAGFMRGLAAAAESVWVAVARPLSGTRSEGVVVRVDGSTGRVAATVRTGTWPAALAPDETSIWVVNTAPFFRRGTLVRIDRATERVDGRPVALGPAPSGIAVGARSVWIGDSIEGTVRRIDALRRRTIATIRVGRQPYALTFAAGSVWVTNADSGTVSRVDPATNRVTATIRVGRNPYGIAAAGRSLWVANLGDGTVSQVDAVLGRLRRTIATGGDPLGVAVAGGAIWVTQNSEGTAGRLE
ncbi:MAG: YncE family protein [Actinomycetota bacterium]|nr:YncE family protein [Actinomycetota bacterium]